MKVGRWKKKLAATMAATMLATMAAYPLVAMAQSAALSAGASFIRNERPMT